MSHETAETQSLSVDPYQFLGIVPNPDGSITRNEKMCPKKPATPDPPHHSRVLSKDVFINQSNNSWFRIFLPRQCHQPLDSLPLPTSSLSLFTSMVEGSFSTAQT
ncbi:hypothetical protein ACOSP7_027332 [Xanthoceras sorbifolium]